jgi:hypothetical protein
MANANGHSNGDLDDMREVLRETVLLQNQQAKMLLRHSELLAEHAERMARFDERMEQIQTSIQALVEISDDLIRNKADQKKRRT